MAIVCTTTTVCDVQVPGTGISVLEPDSSWNSRATSVNSVSLQQNFRYSFDPVLGTYMFTGIYDAIVHAHVLPTRYLAAFEFQGTSFRVWMRELVGNEFQFNPQTGFDTWSAGTRFHVQNEAGTIRMYRGGEEIFQGVLP